MTACRTEVNHNGVNRTEFSSLSPNLGPDREVRREPIDEYVILLDERTPDRDGMINDRWVQRWNVF